MAALAPFLEHEPTRAVGDLDNLDWTDEPAVEAGPEGTAWDQGISSTEAEIAEFNLRLASEAEIGEDLYLFIDRLADELIDLPDDAPLRVDPYFLLAAQRATIGSLRALDSDDPVFARDQLRIRLEQLRQVYRDLGEGEAVYESRPAKELAGWLDDALDVPQARLAVLVGVSARTFQRWVSSNDPSSPDGEDARRLRMIAAAANHLRHALTGPGVVRWFEQPNAQLEGRSPIDLLEDPEGAARLATLAASTRSHTAS